MSNTIQAIINLINRPQLELVEYYNSRHRANSDGGSLEEYIKDLYADTFNETDENRRKEKIDEVFSYLGNDSNPPDAMLRGGDAIEVKKIESAKADIQLNSSYPKRKLESTSSMISQDCRNSEEGKWEKDLLYVVGHVKNKRLKSIFMVYGDDYAASKDVYLGVNMIDSLCITRLRVRGMWILQNPWKVFEYVTSLDTGKEFEFCAIINKVKYESFPEHEVLEELVGKIEGLAINDIEIKDPNNSKSLIAAKMIRFSI